MNTAQHYGQQAQRALRRLQHTLDTLPGDHPAIPHVLQAVALAAVQWRKADEASGGGAGQRAGHQRPGATPSTGQDATGAARMS